MQDAACSFYPDLNAPEYTTDRHTTAHIIIRDVVVVSVSSWTQVSYFVLVNNYALMGRNVAESTIGSRSEGPCSPRRIACIWNLTM